MTEPMLASPSSVVAPTAEEALDTLVASGRWSFELKLDGIRCVATVTDGVPRLASRQGNDMTYRYPEVVAALAEAYRGLDVTLDGEIIVCGSDGRPDFAAVHRRDAQQTTTSASRAAKAVPATFVVFDCLDVAHHPYVWRAAYLREHHGPRLQGPRLCIVDAHDDGATMWQFVQQHDLEGLIAKRKRSSYYPGRSPDWVKLKPRRRLSALVSGVIAGDGRRADSFGALQLSLIGERGELVGIGRVGSGFSVKDLAMISNAVAKGPLVVDVEYMEVSPGGQLRHPVFVGVRTDVGILECTTAQF